MFNKTILLGNLTKDPELRYLQSGSAVCNTAIAVNRKYKTQQGEQREEVLFIDITLFGRTGEIANQYLKKGSKVLVEGRLKLEQWNDQNGQKRSKHVVTVDSMQMLDGKSQDEQQGYNPNQGQEPVEYSKPQYKNGYYESTPKNNQGNNAQGQQYPKVDISDDEIPF